MHPDILTFNEHQEAHYKAICERLADEIDKGLPEAECRLWHAHPVWFLDGNPTVGYSKQKPGVRLMFWSGADFEEPALNVVGKKFKDASIFFNDASEIDIAMLKRCFKKARKIQWDYKNLIKNKELRKLK